MILADCFAWLARAEPNSVWAVVTDPPYGLVEYSSLQQQKLRSGRGGVWRIPPSFDGAKRRPLPRFTVLSELDRAHLVEYFRRFGERLMPALRPGAHVLMASNPLVAHLVAVAMERAGYEKRGDIIRLVRTLRGGDRPKGAESEFSQLSTMPRSRFEPWGLYRKRPDAQTLAENVRRWGTGALCRSARDTPAVDVVESGVTPRAEREIAPHPSVKPQRFLRRMVEMMLPVGHGVVLDPFAGSGAVLAACEARGVHGIGIECDPQYFRVATQAIARLAARPVRDDAAR
jgi:DNA modification methylase